MTYVQATLRWIAMPLWVLASVFWASSAQASQFGCKGLQTNKDLPALEGKDGVFFRIQSDLRMDHRMSDAAIAQLAALSRELASQGTLLVYLPVPTKGLAMPQSLPADAALFGFDPERATQVFEDLIDRMSDAGVMAVNAVPQMRALPSETPPFFAADFHWTGYGARAAAQAIAERLSQDPSYQALPKSEFVSTPQGQERAFSGMRRVLQNNCHDALPQAVTMRFATEKQSGESDGALDLFGATQTDAIALVGTSFSDSEINNFAGFISEATGLDVVNFALTGATSSERSKTISPRATFSRTGLPF